MTARERLRAIKRDGGVVELEMIATAQVGERCISRGVEPWDDELAVVEASLRAHRAVLDAMRARWERRAREAGPKPLRVVEGGGA